MTKTAIQLDTTTQLDFFSETEKALSHPPQVATTPPRFVASNPHTLQLNNQPLNIYTQSDWVLGVWRRVVLFKTRRDDAASHSM